MSGLEGYTGQHSVTLERTRTMSRVPGSDGSVDGVGNGNRRSAHKRWGPVRVGFVIFLAVMLSLTLPSSILLPAQGAAASTTDPSPPVPVANATSAAGIDTSFASTGPIGGLESGTVNSTFTPTVSSLATRSLEPRLVQKDTAYEYTTAYGKYSFRVDAPYVMNFSGPDGSEEVPWSAFLVGASTGGLAAPMKPVDAVVTHADDHTFVVSYSASLDGVSQGELAVRISFSSTRGPKFEANFTQSRESGILFNILWVVVSRFPSLRAANDNLIDIASLTEDQWAAAEKNRVELSGLSGGTGASPTLLVDWSDQGAGDLYVGPVAPFGELLGQGLTIMFPAGEASIDPSMIGGCTNPAVTQYTSERKTFYFDGFYYVVYDDGCSGAIFLKRSPDGIRWDSGDSLWLDWGEAIVSGTSNRGYDLAQRGSEVAFGWITGDTKQLKVMLGSLSKGMVFWSPPVLVANTTGSAGPVGLTIGSDGLVWVAAAWGNASAGYSRYIYKSHDTAATGFALAQLAGAENTWRVMAKPLPLPDGAITIIESRQGDSSIYWESYSNGGWSTWTSRSTNLYSTDEYYAQVSTVAVADGSVWIVYPARISGTPSTQSIDYFTIPKSGPASGGTVGTLSSTSSLYYYPALGADALGRLYLFWDQYDGSLWAIRVGLYFPTAAQWAGFQTVFTYPAGEGAYANITSAEMVSGDAFALFTLKNYFYGVAYDATFIAVPIAFNVGFSPSQPWNRDGISPYGAYFRQQNEYVAPGNGLLTVVQTDLQTPGRGIDLAFSRVFSTPRFFFTQGTTQVPYLYEPDTVPYTGAPTNLGLGWQLNFPWIGGQYLHYLNGQTYIVHWDTYHTFVNHAGEQFVLKWYSAGAYGYTLETADGTNYTFNFDGQPTSMRDFTGQNVISFSYTSGRLATVTDTVGRIATLSYDAQGKVQAISYGGGTVQYSYDPTTGRLSQVLDALGRATRFLYVSGNPWLLGAVYYPSGGRTTYGYRNATFGEATSWLVTTQNVVDGSTVVKGTGFTYDFVNGRVSATNISTGDSGGIYGYSVYNFLTPPTGMTVATLDTSYRQLRKVVTWYTDTGQATQTDTFSGNATTKTFSTFEALDDWGNVIYTRDPVGHQTFSSFANTDSQNEFYTPGRLTPVSNGRIMSSSFDDKSLSGWTLRSGGGSGSGTIGYVRLDNAGDPATAPNINIASLYTPSIVSSAARSFAPQSGTFVAEGRIRTSYNDGQVFFLLRNTAGASAVYFAFLPGGWAGWSQDGYNFHMCAPYAADAWYLVAFEVNVPAGTYNVYINGVTTSECTGAQLRSSGAISSLLVQAGYVGIGYPVITWGDDFRVYSQGRLTASGVPDWTEVEAIDSATGAVANATMVTQGTNALTLNTLNVSSRNYFLRFYSMDQAIRDPNFELASSWNIESSSGSISGGYDISQAHTGSKSYAIRLIGDIPSGAYGDVWQDVVDFPAGGSVRQWLKVGNLTGNGGCSGSPNPSLIRIQLAVSSYGDDFDLVPLGNMTMNVFPTGPVQTSWMEMAGLPARSAFRVHARVTALSSLAGCALAVYFDDIDGPPEYTTPVSDFVGGDAYTYSPPTSRTGEFYGWPVPASIHNRVVGTLSWQNVSSEPSGAPPSRTFYRYDAIGEVTQTKTYHNGTWLYTNLSYDSYGHAVSQSDTNGQITLTGYDAQYQYAYPTSVTRYVDPVHPVLESSTYDFNTGYVTSQTNPRGYATSYQYDQLGRLVKTTQPQVNGVNPTTSYAYDDTNNVLTVNDPDSLPRSLHYDMDTQINGAMEDLSGRGWGGAIGPGVYPGSVGKVGMATQFPGTSAGNIAAPTPFLFPTQSFTIAFWVYATSLPASNTYFAGQPAGANNCVYVYQNNRVIRGALANTAGTVYVTPTATLSLSTWTHVAVSFDGSTLRLYINGVQQGSGTAFSGTPRIPNGTFEVGGYAGLTGIQGLLDEFQVFGSALSGTVISSIYQGTQGGRYLKTYYDGIGRKVRDVQRSFFSGPGLSAYHEDAYVNNYLDAVSRHTTANGSVYQTAYDFLGRPTTAWNPDWTTRTTTYDDAARTVTTTDEVGHKTQELLDVAGRLASVRQYTSSASYVSTSYAYNLTGEIVGVTDSLNQITRHIFDDAGRLVKTLYPDDTQEQYVYDNVGNVILKTDRGGRTIRSAYDGLNRLATVTYPGGIQARYTYDSNGNVLSVQNGTATLWFTFDALDRMTSRSLVISGDPTNYTTSYGYDSAGNLLTLTYPDGQGVLTYAYDAFYRVVSMLFGSKTIATFTYRLDNLLSTISYGDGSLATYVYNDRGFPLEIKLAAGRTSLLDLVYRENATGAVTSLSNTAVSGDSETYVYDWLDRISSSTGPWVTQGYGYDSAGNRLTLTAGSTTTFYKYGAYNKLCESSTSDSNSCATPPSSSVTRYYYDSSGNIIDRVTNGNTSYTFDIDNRLVQACIGSPCTSSNRYIFEYDGLGNRVRESGPSGSQTYTNTFVGSGDQMLYFKSVVGATTTKTVYLYAGALLIATASGSTYSYFHEDHLGSVRMVTKPGSGGKVTVVFSTNYQPFGAQYGASGTDPSVKYTGQWSETAGLYWNHARYYDPTLGRFVSADPLLGSLSMPQTQDRYSYAANNPLRNIDPSGEFLNILIGAIAGAIIGGLTCAVGQGWSNACWVAMGAGAAAGAVAGALFNPALGAATYVGLTGAAATVVAGAVAGAAGGAASYVATGLISPVVGEQFQWSLQGLGQSMLFGAAAGAVGAGVGYGIGRLLGRAGALAGFGSKEIDAVANDLAPGERKAFELTEGTVLRRVFGGSSKAFGRYWTPYSPAGAADAITALELPGTNTAEMGISAYFLPGTMVDVGRTSGGAIEVVIQRSLLRASFPVVWTW